TSIFLEILNVPFRANQHDDIIKKLEEKIEHRESLFLPMATILETGNHIAQSANGEQRRKIAERFVRFIQDALEGKAPFTPINFLSSERMKQWLAEFPDSAMRGISLGDLSTIKDWERQCTLHKARRVYIWTLDQDLMGYDRTAGVI
ncbi:MAG: hypothetical protein PHC50_08135, partial [Candidatus Cloacimonetes bacterium]|nr:hypothetical protein [Candidatus Cloacimonadota bacterium]